MRMDTRGLDAELALSTWFFLYLHPDRSTGGLPAEFLTAGAPALLLFDTVACDQNALDWERPYAARWLSSQLWLALHDEGILRPVDMQRHAASKLLPHLRNSGIAGAALEMMHSELDAINSGRRHAERLAIPPAIKELNKVMFATLGIEMPNAILYPGRENYFKSRHRTTPGGFPGTMATSSGFRERRFYSALKVIVPPFTLLPPVPSGSDAANALRRSIQREKVLVLRYAFGDPDVRPQDILDYRLGSTFKADDERIDGPRRIIAERNLTRLRRLRHDTADVRASVRQILTDVANGQRTVSGISAELKTAQRVLAGHLPAARGVRFDLRLAKLAIAAAALEGFAAAAGLHACGIPSLAVSSYEYLRRRSESHHLSDLRQRYPLAFFVGEVEKVLGKAG